MNLVQLKYFCAVCEFGTLSEAAYHLHVSQPSVSAAVKELESEFGVLLFNRHHSGVQLTLEGRKLLTFACDLIERSQNTIDYMCGLGKDKKDIRLGIPPMIGSLFIPEIFGMFLKENNDIHIEITESGRNVLIDNIMNNVVDIGFLPHDTNFDERFSSAYITKLEVVCCASKDNPLSKTPMADFLTLSHYPVVLFENSFFQTEKIKEKFASQGTSPDILLQTSQLSTMESVVENNLALGFAFRQLIEKNPKLVCVCLDNPLYVDVSLVWKKDKYSFYAMDRLIDFVKNNGFDVV